jgi:hypothetical protein
MLDQDHCDVCGDWVASEHWHHAACSTPGCPAHWHICDWHQRRLGECGVCGGAIDVMPAEAEVLYEYG